MNLHFFTAPFMVYGLWFRVQGSGFEVYCLLIGMKASYEWGMRNEGGGFAASIYGAMPEGSI